MQMARSQRGIIKDGGTCHPVTRRDLARAKGLRNALERGTLPEFIPPEISNPAAKLPNPSWQFLDSNSESTNHANLDVRRQYLEQIFQNSFDPVIIVDKSFHIEYVNAAFEQMFGFTAADTRGQSIDDLVFPADRAAEAQWIAQCLQRGEKLTLETQRRRKDGSLLDVSVSSAPLFSDGKVRAFYAVYRDISERKRAEALSSALYRIAEKSSATRTCSSSSPRFTPLSTNSRPPAISPSPFMIPNPACSASPTSSTSTSPLRLPASSREA